jgi:hypothetical protein
MAEILQIALVLLLKEITKKDVYMMPQKNKRTRKKSSQAIKTPKVFQKMRADLELQKIKTYLSVKAVEYALPLTGYVQQKLTLLQQKLNKI